MTRLERVWRGLWGGIAALPALLVGIALVLWRQPAARCRALIVLAGCLVGLYALSVFGFVMTTPELGFRCAFTPVVNHFLPEYLYPEDQPPLQPDDRIVRLGGQDIATWPQLLKRMTEVPNEPADPAAASELTQAGAAGRSLAVVDGQRVVAVQYERPGVEGRRTVWLRLGQPLPGTLAPSLLWLLLKVGLFAVGAVVYWNRPDDRSAAQFFRLCVVSLGAYIGGYHWWRIVTEPTLLLVFMACALLLPAVSLHFYLVFPRPKAVLERQPRWVLAALYGPPLFFLLLLLQGYWQVRWLTQAGDGDPSSDASRLLLRLMLDEIYFYFGVAAAYYLASLVSLVHSFRHAADATERNQVKWILFGALAAVAPIGYTLYLAFLRQNRFGGGAGTWPMFAASVCVTVAFTVSITRYRLMQLDQIISSGAVYFLLSFLAGVVYYGLVFVAMLLAGSRSGDGPSLWQALGVSSTALVLLAALDVVRSRLKSALDRHFRREKYQLDRTLLRMRQAIDRLVDPPTLARRLLHTAAELLSVSGGAVYLRDGQPALFRLADALGPPPPLAELASGCPLIEALAARGSVVAPPGGQGGPADRQLQLVGGEVAYALGHEDELLAVLVLGRRQAGAYTPDDHALLTAFARLTALALVSARGHRTIEALNRELQVKVEKIAEQQRRILALQSQLTQSSARRAAELEPDGAEAAPTPAPLATGAGGDGLIGSSAAVRRVLQVMHKVAASPSAVLLRGESGTGKGVLARLLHDRSPRAGKPFVKVHCADLSPGLLESELFGHVKGAFTNAIRDKVGRFEAAHGGTVFLDEIGDVSPEVQTKLLRVLQEMTFERVGSSEPVRVDVRVIAATHQHLEELIRQGRFREDLFYRLNVFPITLPPLRQRAEDVPELALHFLRLHAERAGKRVTGIDDDAVAALKAFDWPGNIRQLENVIERAVVIAEGPVLTRHELPAELLEAGDEPLFAAAGNGFHANGAATLTGVAAVAQAEQAERDRREREHLVRVLAAAGGNKAEAARALGVARSTLVSRLKRLGLN